MVSVIPSVCFRANAENLLKALNSFGRIRWPESTARIYLKEDKTLHQKMSDLTLHHMHERDLDPFSPDERLVMDQFEALGIDRQIIEFHLEGKQLILSRDPSSSAAVDPAFPQYDVQCMDLVLTEQ